MAATTNDLQRLLDDAWDDKEADSRTLREQLRVRERQVGELISAGSINSISKNSASQTYSFAGIGVLTTAEVARAIRDLINLYDEVAIALSTSVDATIYNEMKLRLVPVREFTKDFSGLNCV